MDESTKPNGKAEVVSEKQPFARVTLTLDPLKFHVTVDAQVPNYDCALSMLEQAKRAIEHEQRKQQAMQLQQELQQAQVDASVRRRLHQGRV